MSTILVWLILALQHHCVRVAQGATGEPVKVFDRTPNLQGAQIISYRVSPDQKWSVLIGIAPGAPERYVKVLSVLPNRLAQPQQAEAQQLHSHAARQ